MQLRLLDYHHKAIAGGNAKLPETHEKDKRLERNRSGSMASGRKGYGVALSKMWKYALQNAFAVSGGKPELELGRPTSRAAISALMCPTSSVRCSSLSRGFCGVRNLARSARTAAAGFPPTYETTRRNNSEPNEIVRSQVRLAGTKEADLANELGRDGCNDRIFCERIHGRVVEISQSHRLKRVVIEPRRVSYLTSKLVTRLCSFRPNGAGIDVEPFDSAPPPSEPISMVGRIVRYEAGDRHDECLIRSVCEGSDPVKSCSVRLRTKRSRPRTSASASVIVVLPQLFGPMRVVNFERRSSPLLTPRNPLISNLLTIIKLPLPQYGNTAHRLV